MFNYSYANLVVDERCKKKINRVLYIHFLLYIVEYIPSCYYFRLRTLPFHGWNLLQAPFFFIFGVLFYPLGCHHYRWEAPNFDLGSTPMYIEQWDFSNVHLLWHGASVYNGHLRGPVTLIHVAETVTTCSYDLDLLWRG